MWREPSTRRIRVLRRAALAAPLALVAFAVAAGASDAPTTVVVGARPLALANATTLGAVAPATRLALTVTLAPRDPAALAALAAAVSSPSSETYHHYLTVGQFAARFGAPASSVATLRRMLRADGLAPGALARDGLSLAVTGTAAEASRAFDVHLRRFRERSGQQLYANTAAPRMPAEFAGIVTDVLGLSDAQVAAPAGLVRVPGKAPRAVRGLAHAASDPFPGGGGPAACSDASDYQAANSNFFTIQQIAKAYGMGGLYADGDFGQGVTVALFELDPYVSTAAAPTDLSAFQQCYGTDAQVTIEPLVDGGAPQFCVPGQSSTPGDPCSAPTAESAVDLENVIGLAPEAKIEVFEGPNTSAGRYDTLADIVEDDNAQVISDAWGLCEQEDGSDAKIEGNLLEEAAIQGETFLASTGDRGAESCATEWNNNLDDTNPADQDQNAPLLAVDDPASQPDATAVGGTNLYTIGPPPTETAWDKLYWGASGGGISTLWEMPTYQLYAGVPGVVNAYSSGAPCGQTSGYCREVPDVSADGSTETAYVTYFEGGWTAFGGTSTSGPVWAALAALTDSALAGDSTVAGCANGPPLGFMNPKLYEIAAGDDHAYAFNDITSGDNSGYFSGTVPVGPYPATPGYDMVTGLGTPIATDGSEPGLVAQLCTADTTTLSAPPAIVTLGAAEAPAGSPVTITGSGFTPYTAVWFGGTAASTVSDVSPSEIVATVPPGSGSVDVTVTDLAGWSTASAADVFTYAPTESISSPASGAVYTEGQSVSASYACAASAAGTTRCTAPVANGAPIDTASIGDHEFTVTATDANGFATSTTSSYSVIAPPAISISGPTPGAVYAQGQAITAQFSCIATPPATIASCNAPVAPGNSVDTSSPGAHSFTVAAVDSNGVSTTLTAPYTVLPAQVSISGFAQSSLRWLERKARRPKLPLDTTFSFSADQSAQVTLTFVHLVAGRMAHGACVAPALAKRRARSCTRQLPGGTVAFAAQAGATALSFTGSTSTGRLVPGNYVVTLTATGVGGQPSLPVSLSFTIVAPKT
jgi:hypothetical protein